MTRYAFRLAAFVATFLVGHSASAADIGVRIRFGLNDEKPTKWDGTIDIAEGEIKHISGWRFAKGDSIDGVTGWTASTHYVAQQQARGNNQKKAQQAAA